MEFKFNPFNDGKKICWNLWIPGKVDLNHLPVEGRICLLLNRSNGMVYTKEAETVSIEEWNQMSGFDAVISVCHSKENY